MTHPRGLSEEEVSAWEKLAATVEPMPGKVAPKSLSTSLEASGRKVSAIAQPFVPSAVETPLGTASAKLGASTTTPARGQDRNRSGTGNLDGHRDRRLKRGEVEPDFTLDLHGHGLDAAYQRLMRGMAQARAMDARTMLVVTGKPRPVDPADRGTKRGAIRAKILDWLAASEHHDAIAAIRKAHRRHGGDGALYLVLRRGVTAAF